MKILFFSKIGVIIILIIFIIIGGILAWHYYFGIVKEVGMPEVVEIPDDWQIYQRPATIFSFRYPEKWTVDDSHKFYIYIKDEEGNDVIDILSSNLTFYSPFPSKFCMTYPNGKGCETIKRDEYSISVDWEGRGWEKKFPVEAEAKIVIPKEYTSDEDWVLIIALYKSGPFLKDIFRKIITSFEFNKPGIDISNWQTYRNNEHRFEMRYPPQWKFHESWGWNIQLFPNPETIPPEIKKIKDTPVFTINIVDNPNRIDLKEIFYKEVLLNWYKEEDLHLIKVQEVKINNIDGLTFFHFYVRNRCYLILHPYQNDKSLGICFNNEEYDLRGITYIQVFNQILSTFRFLE